LRLCSPTTEQHQQKTAWSALSNFINPVNDTSSTSKRQQQINIKESVLEISKVEKRWVFLG
ncbi:hypothetical protein NQZ68_036206, partial [Dissostichus eleginoides]